jgi:hypothetical protein
MSAEVTCPVCQHRFAGPDGAEGLCTCPRCGAALPRTEVWPAHRNVQGAPPAPAVLATTVCPACGKAVPEPCLLCPHCEEPLAERHRVRRAGTGEEGRGPGLPPHVLWSLGLVGFMGVLICLLVPLAAMLSGEVRDGGLAFLVVVAIIAAALAFPLVVGPHSQAARSWMLFLGHTLAASGCVITLGFAVLLFAGVACAVLLR